MAVRPASISCIAVGALLFHATCDGHHHAEAHSLAGATALVIDSHAGNVEIRAADLEDAELEVVVHGKKTRLGLEIEDGVARAETVCKGLGECAADYLVTVPPDFDLRIDLRQGDIEVHEVRGLMDLETTEGDIALDHLESARVSAGTAFGDIEADGLRVDVFHAFTSHGSATAVFDGAPDLVSVDAGRGDVAIKVPSHEPYVMHTTAPNGKVHIEGVAKDASGSRRLELHADRGDLYVQPR